MLTFLISLEELRTHTHAKNRENLAGLQTHWKRRKNARASHASHHESPEEQPRPQGFAHLFREKPLGGWTEERTGSSSPDRYPPWSNSGAKTPHLNKIKKNFLSFLYKLPYITI